MSIDRTIGPIDRAVAAIEPLVTKVQQAPGDAEQADGPGFVNILKAQLDEMIELQNEAEQLQQALVAGRIDDINQVVLAVQKADLALSFALELRNKVIDAYQEISRMQL